MKSNTPKSVSVHSISRSCSIAFVMVLTLLLSACATSSPDFGDSMSSEGDQYKAISNKWEEGQKLISRGEKKIKKGREQISDGNDNISDGEAMVRRGKRLKMESEEEYKLKKEF